MSGAEEQTATQQRSAALVFKVASEDWEFDQIRQLNYRTFVEEIPQHRPNPDASLEDKFHEENTYFVCVSGGQVVGMMAARDRRPFSLDQKLADLDSYLPPHRSVCEVRLLSVDPLHRNTRVLAGLIHQVAGYCHRDGHDLVVMSGTLRQQKLYGHMGFVPFGPVVGTPEAPFQPMYLTLNAFLRNTKPLISKENSLMSSSPHRRNGIVNLLPGPVNIGPDVLTAFAGMPISHRGRAFMDFVAETKNILCHLVGARRVEILMGSGTFANDAVAGQLSLEPGHVAVLSNGEFGERLIDHAARFRLSFTPFKVEWGNAFERDAVAAFLSEHPDVTSLWAVHSETSTGILNDMEMLKALCRERGLHLCLDCISSIGTVPVRLDGVRFASCVSGKGIGAPPGLSMVFYNHALTAAPQALPSCLDLGYYAEKDGVPFTTSSNLFQALRAALDRLDPESVFPRIVATSEWLRAAIRELGYRIVAPDALASPAVITIDLPSSISSEVMGNKLEQAGYLLSYRSQYLIKRNWIQICLMGDCAQEAIAPLIDVLRAFAPACRVA